LITRVAEDQLAGITFFLAVLNATTNSYLEQIIGKLDAFKDSVYTKDEANDKFATKEELDSGLEGKVGKLATLEASIVEIDGAPSEISGELIFA